MDGTSAPNDPEPYRLKEARAAWVRGWLLMPLTGKVPLLKDWPNLGPPTIGEVIAWSQAGNVGLRTGGASNVCVIDIDSAKVSSLPPEGRELHLRFVEALKQVKTPVMVTGGGQHWYFKNSRVVKNTTGKLAPCVDTKGEKGQVVYAGSVHPETGRVYEWADGLSPVDIPLADVPEWIVDRLKRTPKPATEGGPPPVRLPTPKASGTAYGVKALENECDRVAGAPKGVRNSTLNEAAFKLGRLAAGGQLDAEVVAGTLLLAIGTWGDREEEAKASGPNGTIERGMRDGAREPRSPTPRREHGPVAPVVVHPSSAPALLNDAQLEADSASATPRILIPGPHVVADGRYVEVGNDEFCASVLESVPPGTLYRRAEQIGTLQSSAETMLFRRMSTSRCRNLVDEHVALVRWRGASKDRPREAIYMNASEDHASLIISAAESSHTVRNLVSLTNYPICTGKDFKLVKPGWNPSASAYYDEATRIEPIRSEDRIFEVLTDLICDFPFASQTDRVNFFGLLLTPIVRPALDGNVPLHIVHSPRARTGKTKLIEEVLGGVILGHSTPALQFSGSEEERDKRILALLTRADNIVHLDNLGAFLDSPALASLTTSRSYVGRTLGRSEMVTANNDLTVVMSGNNTHMSGEIAKRCISIQLMPVSDHPEDRTDYSHPQLRQYVLDMRQTVLGCLVGMIENWRQKGFPLHDRPLGGFERHSQVVGGILNCNGLTGHRGNQAEWLKRSDSDGQELHSFVDLWATSEQTDTQGHLMFGVGRLTTAKDLFDLATNNNLFGDYMTSPSVKAQLTSFGRRVLSRNQDAPIGPYRILKVESGSSNFWKLEKIS